MIRLHPRSTLFPSTTLFRTPRAATAAEEAASGLIDRGLDWTATAVEVAGVTIIVLGALVSTGRFLRRGFSSCAFGAAYQDRNSTRLNSIHANFSYAALSL